MMHRISHWLTRHAAALFFPAALILYDFSAYLTTDLIQPGIPPRGAGFQCRCGAGSCLGEPVYGRRHGAAMAVGAAL